MKRKVSFAKANHIYRSIETSLGLDVLSNPNVSSFLVKQIGLKGCAGALNAFYGKQHTEETKAAIRKKVKYIHEHFDYVREAKIHRGMDNGMYGSDRSGSLNPMWGKKHSAETKQKIGKANKNSKRSDETRKQMSESLKQRWADPVYKQMMSELKLGKKNPKISAKLKGLLWWNNGTEQMRSRECPGPDWKRGRGWR